MDKLVDGIEDWEGKLDKVAEQQGYEMSDDDKIQALLMTTPGSLRSKLETSPSLKLSGQNNMRKLKCGLRCSRHSVRQRTHGPWPSQLRLR